jgi:hypothetical protein
VRPLPHELLQGAPFRMVFPAGEQRYEGLITFLGREAYLQYRFKLPETVVFADRRAHKRYPFRPRESAYVIAQVATLPGLGVAGPLVNLGQGGLALRVDRVLKLDDGMRIPPATALFDRGRAFSRIRVQDLPRLHLLEGRGSVAHALERGSEIILGLAFEHLDEEAQAGLCATLDFRERMFRNPMSPAHTDGEFPLARTVTGRTAGGRTVQGTAAEAAGAPGAETTKGGTTGADGPTADGPAPAEAPAPPDTPFHFLQRRTARVVLVMGPGDVQDWVVLLLRRHGYHRLEVLPDLADLGVLCARLPQEAPPALLLADLAVAQAGDSEPLAAVRLIEREVKAVGAIPTVILSDAVDPTVFLAQDTWTRFLSLDAIQEAQWIATLDALLKISGA